MALVAEAKPASAWDNQQMTGQGVTMSDCPVALCAPVGKAELSSSTAGIVRSPVQMVRQQLAHIMDRLGSVAS